MLRNVNNELIVVHLLREFWEPSAEGFQLPLSESTSVATRKGNFNAIFSLKQQRTMRV